MATTKSGPMPGIEDKPMTDKPLANVAEMAQKLKQMAGLSPDERLPESPVIVTEGWASSPKRHVPAVYAAIQKVSGELAKTGIGKDSKNAQQNYSFRGIDSVMNGLSPALVQHGLVIVPRVLSRDVVERTSKSGSLQFFVTVCVEFTAVAVADGSMHAAIIYGEAQDTADKATSKAMSAAYKYFAFLTFCIPTEGVLEDADATTPEESIPVVLLTPPPPPEGYDEWLADMESTADLGIAKLQDAWNKSRHELRAHIRATDSQRWMDLKAKAAKAVAQA